MDSCNSGSGKFIAMILVAVILGGSFVLGKKIETRNLDQFTITVSGEGKVMTTPDIAELSFGVKTGRVKTSEEAMEILGEKMTAVVDAIKAQGVEEKDIKTQNLNLNPAYDWNEGKRIDRGFEANQNVRVKIRNTDDTSKVLSAATSAGANQAGSVNFTIDEPEQLREQARTKAIENGQKKAADLAKQLGKNLGKLKGFNEGGGGMPYARMEKTMAYGMGGGDIDEANMPPVPTGEQEIRVNVNLTYELK
ncbi:MAG: SIMPL domain-containing protein [Candidatus Peribacteraceae bacterium]|jgi:hypothetical protein|nr:SIMPL domain-containing protein [Candidatus Peribacteraceae bacterium]MDP7454790.1 SIMPL domain-containing protein [Candidatus Peribacteraceae bacterium]|tara:strand:+ start:1856 stop:2605 length:750 start_codon:yes stop_codon:yes gene_type:complete